MEVVTPAFDFPNNGIEDQIVTYTAEQDFLGIFLHLFCDTMHRI